ncbi:nitroreductase family protein [Thaumasiovibrio subtropicus]|uniref:nitroreductase family protein n=1 Tax=Thaumasiovibrio subtropicus TaxID=1891207 RepID=UPI000B34AA1D|nr:nitroreductase family protein [Thaumasiovibrio subtropicus]
MTQPLSFEQLIQSRRSVRKYDQETPFDHDAVTRSLKLALLSPNSSNMQLWAFHRVKSHDTREKLADYCMGQNAAKTANELIVITTTPEKWRARAEQNAQKVREAFKDRNDATARNAQNYYEKLIPFLYRNDPLGLMGLARKMISFSLGFKRPMVREVSKSDLRVCLHKSASLAAMTFMTAMRNEGYDTCPMEGFDSKRVRALLDIPKQHDICMIISCGKRIEEGIYGERHRVDANSVIFEH